MRAYIIKLKKSSNLFNNELYFSDLSLKANLLFLRKKDAQKCLNGLMFKNLFEIVKLEVNELEKQ